MPKRLFIAISIPVSHDIVDLNQKLKKKFSKERINWVTLQNFHLTLKFLGDTEDALIPEITNVLQHALKNYKSFEITIKGLGKFSSYGRAKVIWLGVEDTEKTLNKLFTLLNNQLAALGYKQERRFFKAHLTLARIKNIRNQSILDDLIQTYSLTCFQTHKVKDVTLYQSILKPSGPDYKSLTTIPLQVV